MSGWGESMTYEETKEAIRNVSDPDVARVLDGLNERVHRIVHVVDELLEALKTQVAADGDDHTF